MREGHVARAAYIFMLGCHNLFARDTHPETDHPERAARAGAARARRVPNCKMQNAKKKL